jgi:peptidyl-tRNA hydrolase, PTH1 family
LGFFGFRKQSVPDASTRTVLIAGLGNPGREYRGNRHNVGFMVVDQLCEALHIRLSRLQSKALIGSGLLGDSKIVLAKPQTFMNNSGQAVAALVRFYKIPLEQLLVVHDDLDLPFGVLRMRPGGGPGGQKGLGSVIQHLGTQDFPRLRIGVGAHPGGWTLLVMCCRISGRVNRKRLRLSCKQHLKRLNFLHGMGWSRP